MKKINCITFLFVLITSVVFAQNPQAFTYQAIAKDAAGQVLANQAIGIQINIRQSTTMGTIVYQETHATTTTNSGFFSLYIGNGTVTQGTFNTINWGTGLYFMETAMDATGGTSYSSIGTSPVLTVPKANYAYDGPDADATNELISTTQLNGTNLEITDAGGTKTVDLSPLFTGSGAISSVIQDADNDTKIQVEEGADEDVIRFDIEGSERMVIQKTTSGATNISLPNNNKNVFLGIDAGKSNTTGLGNIFSGYYAGKSNTTGLGNIFSGYYTGFSNTIGDLNVFIGENAGVANSTGSHNIFLGSKSGNGNTTGYQNIYLGRSAGWWNTTGHDNVFIGTSAGYNETGSNRLYIENSPSTTPLIYGEFDNDLVRINGTLNINNAFSFPVVDGTNGQALVTDGSGNVTWANLSSSSSTIIQDADNDTKIQVEESADEDIIRFDIEGVEGLTLSKNTNGTTMVEFPNSLTNIFIGNDAGKDNTGNSNLFIGRQAGFKNTTANENTFLGNGSGRNNTTGSRNSFLGAYTGYDNTTGGSNTFFGYGAGRNNTTGNANTFIGNDAGANTNTGLYNTFLGNGSGYFNTTGEKNTFLGYLAGYNNSVGNNNIFVGWQAGYSNTTGASNIFSGYQAGYNNTTGYQNIFSGYQAGYSNTGGDHNIFSGHQAGYSNTTGDYNIFSGHQAGHSNTTGSNNIFSGNTTGSKNTTGSNNIFSGYYAGRWNTTGSNNIFSGYRAGYLNTTGSNNIFSGYYAGYSNTTGDYNTFNGYKAGDSNTTGYGNVFIGVHAGGKNTTGYANIFLGPNTGYSNTTGNYNVFNGHRAGHSNTTGSKNIFLGFDAGYNETGSNRLYIDNSGSSSPLIYGEFDNDLLRINGDLNVTGVITAPGFTSTSDRRLKEQFSNIKNPLTKLSQLNGYTYYWKDKTNDATLQVGVVAQEVEAVLPEIVHTDSKGIKSVDYSKLTALLIEVNKAQEAKITTLEKRLAEVEQASQALKAQATKTAELSAQLKALQQQINQLLPVQTTSSK